MFYRKVMFYHKSLNLLTNGNQTMDLNKLQKKKKTMDLNGNIILIKMFRYNIYVNILLLLIAV